MSKNQALMNTKHETREQWLQASVTLLQKKVFGPQGLTIPADVKVSCSWPGGGSARKRIGECWQRAASKAGLNEIFISPRLEEVATEFGALAVLAHELIHAIDDCQNGHKAPFKRMAKAIGLEGKSTSTFAGAGLQTILREIEQELGPYPHRALNIRDFKKTQKTYLLKCGCPVCTATWRMTQQWVDTGEGRLYCPVCGSDEAVVEGGGDDGHAGK